MIIILLHIGKQYFMFNTIKNSIFPFIITFFILNVASQAQVTGVKYMMEYNKVSNLFDCYLVITEGQATTMAQRTQFNTQFSVLVPEGVKVTMAELHMPLQNNQEYKGTDPCEWKIQGKLAKPSNMPAYDFYSIVPLLDPSAQYNNIKSGDKIKLFSLSIDATKDQRKLVRLFDNAKDPGSNVEGMYGRNFSNGFTMGGLKQLYKGNK